MKLVQATGTPQTLESRYEICIVKDKYKACPLSGSFWVYPNDNNRLTTFELEIVV